MASGGMIRVPEVAVVTATTGRDTLAKTIESVRQQTVSCTHYVFVDGVEWPEFVRTQDQDVKWCRLPVKTGGNGIMNGGVLAASPFLVAEPMIAWLDDDNWFEPDHIEKLLKAKGQKPYAYTLRKLVNVDGSFFDYDDCESLGPWTKFIDANCYLIDRSIAMQTSFLWMQTTGTLNVGDRHLYQALEQNKVEFGATGEYTLNYRLNEKRDLRSFFFENNIKVRAQFPDALPWRNA